MHCYNERSSGPADSFVSKFVVIKTWRPSVGLFHNGFNYYAYYTNSQGPGEFPSWNSLVATAGSGNIIIDRDQYDWQYFRMHAGLLDGLDRSLL